jgi:hypothetical protein
MHERAFSVERNLESLRELVRYAGESGIGIMADYLHGTFNSFCRCFLIHL